MNRKPSALGIINNRCNTLKEGIGQREQKKVWNFRLRVDHYTL